MLKILCRLVVVSTTLIANFSLVTETGVAQTSQSCYIQTSSGQVVDLNKICNRQDSPKAKACEGPFDSDGFPTAFATELEHLEQAAADARKRDVIGFHDSGVQSALAVLYNQMPFPDRVRSLLQRQQQILLKVKKIQDPIEQEKLVQEYGDNLKELIKNKCLVNFMNSVYRKGLGPVLW